MRAPAASPARPPAQAQRAAIVGWAAAVGALTAEAAAVLAGCSRASAQARLVAAARAGLLTRDRPLGGPPTLYAATRAGLALAGAHGCEPERLTAANAAHAIACARAAASLAARYPGHRIQGERGLRRDEHERGRALASAPLGASDALRLHRPDLVLWPECADAPPVAVEVELTVKAAPRLLEICRAWARCRCVAGVVYLAAPGVVRPLQRAIEQASAGSRVVVLALEGHAPQAGRGAAARTVPSAA